MAEVKKCLHCHQEFEIDEQDLVFYDKVSPIFAGRKYSIPPPTLCPECRLQRRISWRNERKLYQRNCGLCNKNIISVYSPESPTPAYCNTCWWGDGWDPFSYARDFDFSRPFFEQFYEFTQCVPQLAIQNDDGVGSINCQYCQDFAFGKNCYFVVGSWYTQDSFYSNVNCSYDKNICDCANVSYSELAYECLDSQRLYNCIYLQNSENCSDCAFGFDLKGCKNCYGCVGLRQKEYYIFNQRYSKEEYESKIAEFRLNSFLTFEKFKDTFNKWAISFPRKFLNMQHCENSVGDHLLNCKNCIGFSLLNSENAINCHQGDGNNFCYDIFNSGKPLWCYEGITPDNSYMTHFCWFTWKCKNTLYSLNCHSSENIFGSIALRHAKYTILNKQYGKEEYEELMARIIKHLQQTNEWGEFFPATFSLFSYNETIAQEYFPMSKDAVLKNGWQWRDLVQKETTASRYDIPDFISDVAETIYNEVLTCQRCKKSYKIIEQEFDLYKKMGIPIPRMCSSCRHEERLARRTPYKLWKRQCANCSVFIQTAYSPDRPEIVYCEKCYLETVY